MIKNSWDVAKTFLILTICTVISLLFEYLGFHEANMITIYILGVQVNALVTRGRLYSFVSSVLSVLVFNYFFTNPRFTFAVFGSQGYPVTFIVMFLASFLTSSLTLIIKDQNRQIAEKAYRTEVLLETNQKLQNTADLDEIRKETALQLVKLLNRTIVLYPREKNQWKSAFKVGIDQLFQPLSEEEQEKVIFNNQDVFQNPRQLESLSSKDGYLYATIKNDQQIFSVVGIENNSEHFLSLFEKSLLTAVLGESALAIEKELLRNEQQEAVSKMEKEQLRANLLRTVSHDLRTPLTGISGTANILLKKGESYSKEKRQKLYLSIYDDSMWLIDLVENLLSITKVENDYVKLKRQTEVMDEIIFEAIKHVDRHIRDHDFKVDLGTDVLLVKVDAQLMTQVIVNLVNNAIKYTPKDSKIRVTLKKVDHYVQVEVSDNGPGISDKDKEKLFDQFYTVDILSEDSRRGLGLGLSLCKGIIQAHGGQIYAKDNKTKGAVIGFTIPLVEVNIDE